MFISKEKFEEKYIPEPMSGCFLWMRSQHRQGYGMLKDKRKTVLAHRTSWELYKGEIPKGMKVLHRCDNPPCVNVDHLFLGTQKDNINDCFAKGRVSRIGIKNSAAKLTNDQVVEIKNSPSPRGLARKFGVDRQSIWAIRSGKNWGHLFCAAV